LLTHRESDIAEIQKANRNAALGPEKLISTLDMPWGSSKTCENLLYPAAMAIAGVGRKTSEANPVPECPVSAAIVESGGSERRSMASEEVRS
jgi:hypothetical protein